jgi:hypothetical protein
VTVLEHYATQLYFRQNQQFTPIMYARALLQLYLCDAAVKIEFNNLKYILDNQKQWRREHYQGLYEHYANRAVRMGVKPRTYFEIKSSFGFLGFFLNFSEKSSFGVFINKKRSFGFFSKYVQQKLFFLKKTIKTRVFLKVCSGPNNRVDFVEFQIKFQQTNSVVFANRINFDRCINVYLSLISDGFVGEYLK